MNPIELRLSQLHGKKHVSLVGNCTVGIVGSLQVLGLEGKRVGIPNNVCFSVPQAVIYAGAKPVYIDVEPENFGLCPECAAEAEGLSALIAVHAYGRFCFIDQLVELCREKGWYLVEDFAVAQGANSSTGVAGSFGDISITSFGAGKITDIEHGGAILTDNLEWSNKIKRFADGLPDLSDVSHGGKEVVSRLHTKIYNTQFLHGRMVDATQFRAVVENQRESYFFRWKDECQSELKRMLDDLPAKLEQRRTKATRLAERLKNIPLIKVVEHGPNDVYWRLNLIVVERRDELLRMLLDEHFPVSSWQPSVDLFMEPVPRQSKTPISDEIGEKIINLWVNDQVDDDYIDNISKAISNFFNDS